LEKKVEKMQKTRTRKQRIRKFLERERGNYKKGEERISGTRTGQLLDSTHGSL
jgi:hypothetical protein